MPFNHELYIPPAPVEKNPTNGRFLKGHTPFNKGKKMSEWMDGRKIKKVIKCLERKGNPNLPGSNRKKIIGIKDGKVIGVFESSVEAGKKLGLIDRNIRHCCEGKRDKCGTIMWFWEFDFQKWSKYITN